MQDYIIKTSGRALAQALIADLPEEHGLSIITFGVVSRPTGETATDEDRQEVPVMEPVDGYWLIVRAEAGALPESWSPFVVPNPGYLPGGFSPYAEPTPSPEKLAQAKKAKLAEIKTAFSIAEENGYVVSSLDFRADATRKSIEDIDGLIDLISSGVLPEPVRFRDFDNAYHDLTLSQLSTLRLEVKSRGPRIYAHKWTLEEAVITAKTIAEVLTIDTSDWPGITILEK